MLTGNWTTDVSTSFATLASVSLDDSRTPEGIIYDRTPTFRRPLDGYGMFKAPKLEMIQIQKEKTVHGSSVWKNYTWGVIRTSSDSWTPKHKLALGRFRWRIVAMIPPTYLPPNAKGASPVSRPTKFTEVNWTEFSCPSNEPGS